MDITFKTIKGLSFGVYSAEEIAKLSVIEVFNIEILDCLGNPAPNGLYDLRMGPNERDDICGTCHLDFMRCAGHPGHINLPLSVYNPVFFSYLYQLLRGSCFYCNRLLVPPLARHLTLYQLQALDYGLVGLVQELAEAVTNSSSEDTESVEDVIHVVKSKLEKKFEDAVKGNKSDVNFPVKSVVECRRNIFKNFIRNHMMKATGKCPNCRKPVRKIACYNMRLVYKDLKKPDISADSVVGSSSYSSGDMQMQSELSNKELNPEDARKHLRLLWENEKVFLRQLYKILHQEKESDYVPVDMFFMSRIIVPPSRFRRLSVMHGRKHADPQTIVFNEVLKDCSILNKLMRKASHLEISDSDKDMISKLTGKNDGEKFSFAYHQLQRHVTEIFDSDINKERNKVSQGIKQILEKKEGLFRMNMMGKRVNFAARSVISSDPYIMVNEIGIPLVFAKKLTFPEPVNYWNIENLKRAVMNGPNVHPGASLVEMEDGRKIKLSADDPGRRQAIANTLLTPPAYVGKKIGGVKIVHRHVKNGDMLLLNRQPTLHKPSIMAHKARVLPGEKTLRLHYANCKSYNADFDGDEMNAHLPQSYPGQGECRHIVGVNHQYLVPKDGTPLSGLIQDHIIAGVLLTMRGRFFHREEYQQLIYSAMSFHRKRLRLLPPAILKPETMWSGKQIVSTIIINLIPEGKQPPTVEGKSKVSSKNWKTHSARDWIAGGTPLSGDAMSESEVVIRNGELLCGVIDKAHVGPTPYSLVHICYELYGGETSSVILTALARLFTHYLQYYSGFSLGIEDIVVNKKPNKKRRRILRTGKERGSLASAQSLDVDDKENPDQKQLEFKYKETHFCRDDFGLKMLDMEMKKVTHALNNEINEVCIPSGLRKKFPNNNLQLMIESGAKGSSVNAMQISCLLGQIELEGRRMPLMLNGSTLPSFQPYETSPRAGGFVGGRFLSGINPQEYFFHCMAGREGLIDTAVKTSRSGYLQRCLIKHLEGVTVNYDLTVRDGDGTVIQFLYGEDGMDPLKMQLLKENRLHLLGTNYKAAVNEKDIETLKAQVEVNLEKEKKKIRKWKKRQNMHIKSRLSCVDEIDNKDNLLDLKRRLHLIEDKGSQLDVRAKKIYKQQQQKCPAPVNSKHRPDLTFGSVSEKMDYLISDYVSKNPHRLFWEEDSFGKQCITAEQFKDLCYYRSLRSLAEPGETVGLLAAQSIGEPSTQMTLNTFHFAGKGEMNVTLGIPRIREILMTATANIATPTMDLPLLDKPGIERQAEKLKLKLSPVALKDMLDGVKIKEYISIPKTMMNTRNYIIRMNFLKYSEYKGHVNTTPTKILYFIENVFVKKLLEALKKKMKISLSSRYVDVMKETVTSYKSDQNEVDDDVPVPSMEPVKKDEGESSEESEGEGDTTSAKSKSRHDQDQCYEDPEEDEIVPESSNESDEEITVKEEPESPNEEDTDPSFVMPQQERKKTSKINVSNAEEGRRINYVKCIHSWVFDYSFDTTSEKWCEISLQIPLAANKIDIKSLLEEEISKANIYSVPQIKEAILVKDTDSKDNKLMLKTNGVNFLEIFKYVNILDINKVYSNNIYEISKIYGIEAAARALRKEIVNVFAAYGIQVDSRHLSLVSDYMTCSGQYRPCNRLGMEGNASPLQQMTFETTKNFLVDSMLMGVKESIKSPSANVVVGQLYRAGTGSFDLFCKPGRQ